MKRLNKKLTTLILAGACALSLGAATVGVVSTAADEAANVGACTIADVFTTTGEATAKDKTVAFTLGNGENAYIKRDLAFQWYEGKDAAKYYNMKFAFESLNFESVTVELQSDSSVVTEEEDRAINAVKFTVEEGKVYATVINGETEGVKTLTTIAANSDIVLKLGKEATTAFDAFEVYVNDVDLGEFTKIGENYADYVNKDETSLKITAKTAEAAETVVLLKEINGQKFDNVEDSKIADTAAPVLGVNEDISGFQYGTVYSTTTIVYQKMDVLQSSATEEKQYYAYNPADTEVKYKSLTTSTYFMDTVYYTNGTEFSKEAKEGYDKKSVMNVDDQEYVAIQFILSDKANQKMTYDLSWYANASAIATPSMVGATATEATYMVVNQNKDGAVYKFIATDDTAKTNVVDDAAKTALVDAYQAELTEAANDEDACAGGSIILPDVEGMIDDNGGYRSLRFTISYKTESSSSAKTSSNLAYDALKLSISDEGEYEFKIFANDKAGNTMKYYDEDGELVDITASNVWDFDEIPSFTFYIKNSDIKVKEATTSDKKAEKLLDQTYTLSGMTVIGASSQQSKYALYRMNLDKYQGPSITETALTGVKYEDIRKEAKTEIEAGKVGKGKTYATYFDLYLDLYASKVATAISGDKAKIKACFEVIDEYNANITEDDTEEWEAYNKYNWNASSKSFTTAEEGNYLILGDFWENEIPLQRAAAYKVVIVESEEDVIKGESKFGSWIKNNKVSVVLFAVAGVMLIAIVILLLIKPSDETLEDVDAKAEKKAKKNKDKAE